MRRILLRAVILGAGIGVASAQVTRRGGVIEVTKRVSVGVGGVQGNSTSFYPSMSADGRCVAFWSYASNLVPGDTNGRADVFVRNLQTGKIELASVDSAGVQGNEESYFPCISASGRFVAFVSLSSNLVTDDNNAFGDIFVRDILSGTTERVSVDSGGNEANNYNYFSSISADGRHVAFYSDASNLVSGDTNGFTDVFVRDRLSGTTERVSVASGGAQASNGAHDCSISADGRYVAFTSFSPNLVAGDTNGGADVFVRDRSSGITERVSIASGGEAESGSIAPSISGDGHIVAFRSFSSNLVGGDLNGNEDIFVHDRQMGTTELVSVASDETQGNGHNCDYAFVCANGRYITFQSNSSNLVSGDTNESLDIFVRDRLNGTTLRASVPSMRGQGDGDSEVPSISADGRYVVFFSRASNLVPGDTNGMPDVFVRVLR